MVLTYSWLLLFALASDLYSRRQSVLLTFVSLCIGMAGLAVIHALGQALMPDAWLGYADGLASGFCWVGYSLFLQVYSRPVVSAYPAFFTVAAAIAFVIQACLNGLVWPESFSAWIACAVLGIGSYSFGFLALGHVQRHGNPRIVPVLPCLIECRPLPRSR